MRNCGVEKKQLELAEFQDPKAFFTIRHIDTYGFIWAHTPDSYIAGIEASSGSIARFHIFSPEGEYLGDTELNLRRAQLQHGRIVSIEEDDETGAYEVILYRILPAVDGFQYPG